MADAVTAGLAGGDNWRKHPKAMLRARALSAIARLVYPDLLLGVYDPDELTPQPERDVTPVVLPAAEAIAARLKAPAASPPRDADFTPHPAEAVRQRMEAAGFQASIEEPPPPGDEDAPPDLPEAPPSPPKTRAAGCRPRLRRARPRPRRAWLPPTAPARARRLPSWTDKDLSWYAAAASEERR